MTNNSVIEVAIIEDDPETREMLQQLLSTTRGFSCTGAFESCELAFPRFRQDKPQVVLVDIGLPGMSGIEGVRQLKLFYPDIHAVMLTVYQDDDKIFQSICAGASGYLLKRTPKEVLLNAIREAYGGGMPMNAGIARRVLELFRKTAAPIPSDSSLTQREVEILQELVNGSSYKMIANHLCISIETVRNHIKHIYDKLHVHSKSEAVAKALREKLV